VRKGCGNTPRLRINRSFDPRRMLGHADIAKTANTGDQNKATQ
jgi:hypothetical protein